MPCSMRCNSTYPAHASYLLPQASCGQADCAIAISGSQKAYVILSRVRVRSGFQNGIPASRFFCFPIQMNYAENQSWGGSKMWRGPCCFRPGGYMNGGQRNPAPGNPERFPALAGPLQQRSSGLSPVSTAWQGVSAFLVHCTISCTTFSVGAAIRGCRLRASRLPRQYWKSPPTKAAAPAVRRTGDARLASEGTVFRRCWLGSVVDWPMASSTTEQQGATTRSERRNGCSCALSPPSGAPRPHGLQQVRCGGRMPWGTERGKADCRARRCWLCRRRCERRALAAPTSNLEISPALKYALVANPGER
jgi:hypothetical protein